MDEPTRPCITIGQMEDGEWGFIMHEGMYTDDTREFMNTESVLHTAAIADRVGMALFTAIAGLQNKGGC